MHKMRFNFMATSNYLFCEFLNSVSKGTFDLYLHVQT